MIEDGIKAAHGRLDRLGTVDEQFGAAWDWEAGERTREAAREADTSGERRRKPMREKICLRLQEWRLGFLVRVTYWLP